MGCVNNGYVTTYVKPQPLVKYCFMRRIVLNPSLAQLIKKKKRKKKSHVYLSLDYLYEHKCS